MRALVLAVAIGCACAPLARATPTPAATTPSPVPTASPTTAPSPTQTASPTPSVLPIFDAHLHYSQPAWSAYPPQAIATLLDAQGVRSAFVSSAPDEGTFRLKAALGDRVIPTLGPYRNVADVFAWTRDPSILPYLESIYRPGLHRGFGEFHLNPGQTGLPVVRGALALAEREQLFLQPHADARAVAELLAYMPDATVLWAHGGVTAAPDQIGALLDRWPKLWVELSLRDDVAPNGRLDPAWRELLVRHSGRFMVGTDTWTAGGTYTGNERWDAYAEIVGRIRSWLRELPPDAAEAIAHRNAERFLAQLPPR